MHIRDLLKCEVCAAKDGNNKLEIKGNYLDKKNPILAIVAVIWHKTQLVVIK